MVSSFHLLGFLLVRKIAIENISVVLATGFLVLVLDSHYLFNIIQSGNIYLEICFLPFLIQNSFLLRKLKLFGRTL